MPHRREITQVIITLLPAGIDVSVDEAMKTWYRNIRESGGFRLTSVGYQALRLAAVNCWSIDVDYRDINKSSLLALDRKLTWPYYLDARGKKLVLFSSRDAVMVSLYGDVKAWLDSI